MKLSGRALGVFWLALPAGRRAGQKAETRRRPKAEITNGRQGPAKGQTTTGRASNYRGSTKARQGQNKQGNRQSQSEPCKGTHAAAGGAMHGEGRDAEAISQRQAGTHRQARRVVTHGAWFGSSNVPSAVEGTSSHTCTIIRGIFQSLSEMKRRSFAKVQSRFPEARHQSR